MLTDDLNEANGLIAKVAWVKDAIQIPLFLVKSDGGYGYDSTDAAAIRYRIKDLNARWLIYVTGESCVCVCISDCMILFTYIQLLHIKTLSLFSILFFLRNTCS